ncbi:RagB/SusD family nutrient uptake outer membrane protein [Marinigracilibium pacificum]|uniref:RagB/SusD family nutrient uptake outer membrane protein n=1 Tax=Marinigracilibium pacificum TaxID=2729599 RepID=A0A848J878_9BACT|nr:RagB/SusD family nutrient uptake outer membrane protein [Marinigracilibium pacificum]NMM50690.1 RagB/SusD family nutrient uptake outer membrane protein [Marinigracilibium pacificum]
MKRYYIYLLLLLVISSGCEGILDVEPTDLIIGDEAFKSLDDIEAGVIAAYGFATDENIIEFSSVASDDVYRPSTNRGQGVQLNSWSYVTSNTEAANLWYNSYRVIAQANRVLNAIESLIAQGVITVDESNQFKSEMLALRAHKHFDLYRAMGEKYSSTGLAVPYIDLDDNNGNGSPDGLEIKLKPSRLLIPEFFNKLFKDIEDALETSTVESVSSGNVSRFNYYAIKALEARAALYAENYDRAINAANIVIANMDLCAFNDYTSIWEDASIDEVIFKLERTSENFQIGTIWTGTNLDIFFAPSYEITSVINPNVDIRYYSSFYTLNDGRQIVAKYLGSNGVLFQNDIKVFRVSEMYLIRAEANLKTINSNLAKANEDLNSLRSQRIYGYVPQNISDKDQLLQEILLERRKELAFEGHRFFDLKRNGLPIERSGLDCGGAIPCTLEAGNFRFNLPIPQEEIFANENIQQNPGYSQN